MPFCKAKAFTSLTMGKISNSEFGITGALSVYVESHKKCGNINSFIAKRIRRRRWIYGKTDKPDSGSGGLGHALRLYGCTSNRRF
jgi:hypothetical protein